MFFSWCAFACESTNNPNAAAQAQKLYGQKVKFPTSYLSIAAGEEALSIDTELAKPLKIVTYLDKNSCSECALRILLHWNEYIQNVSDDSVGFIHVVYPNDASDLKEALKALQIDFPLFYDKENKFLKMNKMEKTLARNRSFLLDAHNRITVVGEPLGSETLWRVYTNAIEREKIHK